MKALLRQTPLRTILLQAGFNPTYSDKSGATGSEANGHVEVAAADAHGKQPEREVTQVP